VDAVSVPARATGAAKPRGCLVRPTGVVELGEPVTAQVRRCADGGTPRRLPDERAINTALRIDGRRAKLLGLEAPTLSALSLVPLEMIDAEIARLEAQQLGQGQGQAS
jgi:hypothetical protein